MDEPESRRFADHLQEYVRDSTLWPVLLVAVGIVATIGASVLLATLGGNLYAAAAGVLLVVGTLDAGWREWRDRGFGVVGGLLVLLWSLSALAALAARWLGIA